MIRIKDSRVIVTGGAQGIGFQICRDLLMNNAKIVVIIDISKSMGQESMTRLNDEFGADRCLFYTGDVSKPDEFNEIFGQVVKKLGGIEIFINNAGIFDDENWSYLIDVNLKGTINGCLLALNHMGMHKGGKGGTIINISALSAFLWGKTMPVYSATKAAIVAFTRCLALNYEKTGVEVKAICPSFVDTYMTSDRNLDLLDFIDRDEVKRMFRELPKMTAQDFAKDIMRLIQVGPNGAIWAKSQGMQLLSVQIPKIKTIFSPI